MIKLQTWLLLRGENRYCRLGWTSVCLIHEGAVICIVIWTLSWWIKWMRFLYQPTTRRVYVWSRKAMEKIRDQKRRREGLIMNDNLVVVDDFWWTKSTNGNRMPCTVDDKLLVVDEKRMKTWTLAQDYGAVQAKRERERASEEFEWRERDCCVDAAMALVAAAVASPSMASLRYCCPGELSFMLMIVLCPIYSLKIVAVMSLLWTAQFSWGSGFWSR